ncbi:MAG: diaminopimelate epimerase [Chitinophagaceae bacterium]|nr:MAG: diaminopimelate epimerase [Chitinophagaceae bacterium]
MTVHFFKYQGVGNDFIILDNRDDRYNGLGKEQILLLCNRHFGVGADGLMMLNDHPEAGFEMKYFNSDGKEGSMCGNGGRCIVAFAHRLGLTQDKVKFMAYDGIHEAVLTKDNWVELKMSDVKGVEFGDDFAILNTGSPHYVKYVEHLGDVDVVKEGRGIRNSARFKKDGINVNFVEYGTNHLLVRTYERGVEDETKACGTGVTAAALVVSGNQNRSYKIPVATNGGELEVRFDKINQKQYENIWLCGPAEFVFEADIELNK